jgi:molybdopterin converting factor subunit 1
MPRLEVKLFAVLRERIGRDVEPVDVDGPLTAGGLLDLLRARYPDHARVFDQCRVAVNRTFINKDHAIAPGDEVALIPPIAGGSRCTA